ncbi:hypothetical protein BH23CHL7_BH23CHL7_00630 [soil metagenome]
MPDDEYRALARTARSRGKPVSEVVRDSLRKTLADEEQPDPEARIAAVLRFARFSGPSADIDQILADIERGRGLA